MKHKVLPPPTSVGVSQTLTIRSHAFYRCGRFLSVAFLLLFMFMPFSKTMGQCSTTLVTYSTCNSSYTLYAPLNANCDYWWFECDASGGNATVLNGNVSTPSLNVAPPSGSGNQTTYYMYYEVNNSTSASCFSAVITVKWDYDLAIANTSGTVGVQSYSSITYNTYQWYQVTGAGNIYITNTSTYTPTASGLYFLTATPSCGGGTRTSNTVSVCVSNTQCNTNPTSNATCAGSFYLSFTPAAGYTVDWYECDASGSSLSPIAASTNNTTVYPASSTGNQTNYYRYICNDAYCTSICTSAVITVYWDYDLEITSDLASPPNYSIQPYSSIITYSNHQWYRNNSAISSGANSPVYSPTISGSYTLMADASCSATRTSNAIIYNAPNTQCSSTPVTYATCSTAYNLSFTPASNYDVTWYECDATGNNGTLLNSSPSNTIAVSPSNTTDQTFYYYYVCTDNYSYATCTSAVITVEFNGNLNIHGGSSLPTTLSANTPNIAYSSYQWYRNGQLIPIAGNNSYYNATLAGDYYMTCTSTCGTSTSNIISFCGSTNSYATNYAFSGVTNISGGNIVLDGMVTIPAGAIVNISGATIIMKPNAGITIEKNSSNNNAVHGGELNITGSTISSCSDWKGIFVRGASSPQSIGSGALYLRTSSISEAYLGVYADECARLDIATTTFENNYSHMQLNEFNSLNNVHGVEMEFSNCDFNNLMNATPTSSLPSYVASVVNGSYRPMIYLYNTRTISFTGCEFKCENYAVTRDQIGIDAITVTGQAFGWDGLKVTDCNFDGEFNAAMYIEDGKDLTIGYYGSQNYISGDFLDGISIKNGSNVNIEYTNISYTASSGLGHTALKMDQSVDVTVTDNLFEKCIHGVEYYFDQSGTNNTTSNIHNNTFFNNSYGLVYAPLCNPIGNVSCNNGHYTKNGSNTSYFNFGCNKIWDNGYGIIGTGDMNTQGDATDGWGNFFYDVSVNTSRSTNSDIVWYNNGNKNTIFPDLSQNLSTTSFSIILDGATAVTQSNLSNQLITTPKATNDNSCYQNFKTDPNPFNNANPISKTKTETKPKELKIFPNPFNNIISIEGIDPILYNVVLYNMQGQKVWELSLNAASISNINAYNLSAGCYMLNITERASGKLIKNERMIKTQ